MEGEFKLSHDEFKMTVAQMNFENRKHARLVQNYRLKLGRKVECYISLRRHYAKLWPGSASMQASELHVQSHQCFLGAAFLLGFTNRSNENCEFARFLKCVHQLQEYKAAESALVLLQEAIRVMRCAIDLRSSNQ